MSKMVSARVPDALYEQASIQLTQIGASPSELVNAAFEYLIEERVLPKSKAQTCRSKKRVLSEDQKRALIQSFRACSLRVDIPTDISYDKQAISEARGAKYEALA